MDTRFIEEFITTKPWFVRKRHYYAVCDLLREFWILQNEAYRHDNKLVQGLELAVVNLERQKAEVETERDKASDQIGQVIQELGRLREMLTCINKMSSESGTT